MLLSECIDNYITKSKPFLKDRTIYTYNKRKNLLLNVFGDYEVSNITQDVMQNYIIEQQNKGRAKNVIKSEVNLIALSIKEFKQFNQFRWLNTEQELNRVKRVYSEKEVEKIKNYILGKKNISNPKLAILIAMFTGMRISEIVGLKWEDVDFENKEIYIRRNACRINKSDFISVPKTSSGYRKIAISDILIEILEKRKGESCNYVITNSKKIECARIIQKANETVCKNLGIECCGFHAYRHFFATKLLSVSNDFKAVSQIMGHSNINITQQIYNHPTDETKRDIVELALRDKKREDKEKDDLKEQVKFLTKQNKDLQLLVEDLKKTLSKLYT